MIEPQPQQHFLAGLVDFVELGHHQLGRPLGTGAVTIELDVGLVDQPEQLREIGEILCVEAAGELILQQMVHRTYAASASVVTVMV